ncbi:9640_t:CDS:1, partial [Cetraspora pellucida]
SIQVTPILDNDIGTSNSSHESCLHLEPEKLSRIPSNTVQLQQIL